jgi:dTMP kinase
MICKADTKDMLEKLRNSLSLLNLQNNPYKGKLIVLDGLQRSGKSTIIQLIMSELSKDGIGAVLTEWNSYPGIQQIINDKKMTREYTPMSWFVLHYADFILRYEEIIVPALQNGKIVICDRYIYTALSRDVLKGVDPCFIINAYENVIKPDITLFFTVNFDIAYERYKSKVVNFKQPYNTGEDIFGSDSDLKSTYIKYNQLLEECYLILSKEFEIPIFDTSYDSNNVSRDRVIKILQNYKGLYSID